MIAVLLAWLSALLLTLAPAPTPILGSADPAPVTAAPHASAPVPHHRVRAPHSTPRRPTAPPVVTPAPEPEPLPEDQAATDLAEQLPEEVTGRQIDDPADGVVCVVDVDLNVGECPLPTE